MSGVDVPPNDGDSELPRTQRTASYALIVKEDRVLLVRAGARSATPGKWYLPGGGVAYGESPHDAVVRETHEETGLSIDASGPVAALSDIVRNERHGVDTHTIRLIYTGVIRGGDVTAERDGTSELAAWFRIDELPTDAMPFVPEAIRCAVRSSAT